MSDPSSTPAQIIANEIKEHLDKSAPNVENGPSLYHNLRFRVMHEDVLADIRRKVIRGGFSIDGNFNQDVENGIDAWKRNNRPTLEKIAINNLVMGVRKAKRNTIIFGLLSFSVATMEGINQTTIHQKNATAFLLMAAILLLFGATGNSLIWENTNDKIKKRTNLKSNSNNSSSPPVP